MLNLTESYYSNMGLSLGDKENLLDNLVGDTVLELGFGSGELLLRAKQKGFNVIGVDASDESVNKGSSLGLTVYKGDHTSLENIVRGFKFDNIILCSVLHEVYSYTRNEALKTKDELDAHLVGLKNVEATIKSCYRLLNKGGKLLIRDGVKPDDESQVIMKLFTFRGIVFMEKFIKKSNNYIEGGGIKRLSETSYLMDYVSAMEFICTYTWGEESFPREVKEQYGVYDKRGYLSLLTSCGFGATKYTEYVQLGYYQQLKNKLSLKKLDGTIKEYPSTNMVMVATKLN